MHSSSWNEYCGQSSGTRAPGDHRGEAFATTHLCRLHYLRGHLDEAGDPGAELVSVQWQARFEAQRIARAEADRLDVRRQPGESLGPPRERARHLRRFTH